MRQINVFKIKAGRIEYTDKIKQAVLDPRITGLNLHMNGGYDWADHKYGFIKLLISRGQVERIYTHSDLMAHDDYIDAIVYGRSLRAVEFDTTEERSRDRKHKSAAYASIKRMISAKSKFESKLIQVQKGA